MTSSSTSIRLPIRPDATGGSACVSTYAGHSCVTRYASLRSLLAAEVGVTDRARFEVAAAKDHPGADYDLVTFFDCLHDMGDPAGAVSHAREVLRDDGTVMLVEPFANDRTEDNLNPVGRAFYGFSTVVCTMASKAQEVGLALGAQAGEARLRDLFEGAGFTTFRRAIETPFNLVLEARP